MKTLFSTYLSLFKTHIEILLKTIIAFLIPIRPLLYIIFLMILLDTITGVIRARKIGDKITSHKLSRVISKMVLYHTAIITTFILEKYMLGEFVVLFTTIQFFLTKVVTIFFSGIELMSINENVKSIYGLNFFQLFKKMLSRIKEVKDDVKPLT
jgi:hypothetical protein